MRSILFFPGSVHSRTRCSTAVCQSVFRFLPSEPAERRAADSDGCRGFLSNLAGRQSKPEVERRLPAACRKPQGVRKGVALLGPPSERAAVAEIPSAEERKSHPRPQCHFPIIRVLPAQANTARILLPWEESS